VVCGFRWALRVAGTVNRLISGAGLREADQAFAVEVEIDQREAGAQSMVVLRQPPVADFIEAEDAFEDAERMFHLSPDAGLALILCSL